MINFSTKSKIYLGSAISKLLTKILGASERVIKRDKIYYKINLGEGIDLGIFLGLKNERKIFNVAQFLNNNRKNIIIDIGSNVGSVTLPLAKKFQNSIIISIEPTKYAFKKLLFNTNLNPDLKKRIKLINSFVTNKKKAANKVHASWNFSNAKNKHKVHMGTLKETSNKFLSIDNIAEKFFGKIEFIKIDVDGYELDVLKSGKKTLIKHKPIIYFEFAPYLYKEFGYGPNTLIKFITKDLNYSFYNENFQEVLNIEVLGSQIKNRSENFFLIHKNKKKIYGI